MCSVTQSCPTLCDPMNGSPLGSSVRGIFLGKNTGVGSCFLLQGVFLTWKLKLQSPVSPALQAGSLLPTHLGSPLRFQVDVNLGGMQVVP